MKPASFKHPISVCILFGLMFSLHAADGPEQLLVPDLTKGGELTRINQRWVGPVGIFCGAWRPRQRSDEAKLVRQLLVQKVEEGSPAAGVLEVGDVILGADGTGAKEVPLFPDGAGNMLPIANAITEAEARNPALLKLLVWRKGETKTMTVKLEHLGRYSETAPYDCEKSRKILRLGLHALAQSPKVDKAGFGLLCLLAADDPSNPENEMIQAKAREWAHQLEVGGGPWHSGPQLMALAEYYMKTRDEAIFPKLVAQAEHHAKGVSWFGTTGHRWCELQDDGSGNGRIAGYGPISCSGALGYLGLSLAREAGVKSELVEKSHKAQRAFFGHFAFKSGIGYGEHAYGIGGDVEDYNGKCAMSALALSLDDGQEDKAKYFSRRATLSSCAVRQYAHGGSYFGQVFHPLGANLGGAKSANLQFREISWHMDLKRRWDHAWIYDATGNGYNDFSSPAVALLFYAAPLKQLVITGRGRNPALEFSDAEMTEMVFVKNFDPSKATDDELIRLFPKFAGLMRGVAGDELARRIKAKPEASEASVLIDRLLGLALNEKTNLFDRVGACYTLMQIKDRTQEPTTSLKNADIAKGMAALLQNPDAYIRFAAVRVLQKLDPVSVRAHVDAIMDAIVATERPVFPLDDEDPCQWAHGEMGELLVKSALKEGLDGVDRAKLIPAIRSLLKTPNGSARSSSTEILAKLNKEEVMAVSDLLIDNIRTSPPANAMFAKKAALNSQAVLAQHRFEEALPLSTTYGPGDAIKSGIPQKFGKSALRMGSARKVMMAAGEQILVQTVEAQALVDGILNGETTGEFAMLKRIDSIVAEDAVVRLPKAETKLVADATNFAMPGDAQTIYTWRKVHGAGRLSFEPNATGQSKTTKVIFTDKKPGKYAFELEMSDALGLTVARQQVLVTLLDASGKLPSGRPPEVKSLSLNAVPGQPLTVTLSGADPDGDELGYVVKQLPAHGTLTDVSGRQIGEMAALDKPLVYTADYGYEGVDQLEFVAVDGQGNSVKGVVSLTVSAKDVGVLVYEGFDYPAGAVHGRDGGSSFGFSAPWQMSKVETGKYLVDRGAPEHPEKNLSLSYPGMPATGGKLKGGRHRSCSRTIDPSLIDSHGLLQPGGELWFSVYVDGPAKFGLKGDQTALGFLIEKYDIFAALNGQKAGTARNPWSRTASLRFPDQEPQMIIGHCVWGMTDKDPDTLKIYRVYNAPVFGPMLLDESVCVLQEAIPQQVIDSLYIELDDPRAIDEIRIGSTLPSVMLGTKPLR